MSGEQVDLIVEGVIGIESDAVPPIYEALSQLSDEDRILVIAVPRTDGFS